MSEEIEFATKAAADTVRDRFEDKLCSDDDRRLKTVTFSSEITDEELNEALREAEDSKADAGEKTGQVPLTDEEKDEIDFSESNVLHARSAKGVARTAGVDDWLSFYDEKLTVDEHREVYDRAAREESGRRMDAEDSPEQKAGEAARTQKAEECDHAEGHCAHGDQEACEFLRNRCGLDPEDVSSIMSTPTPATKANRRSQDVDDEDLSESDDLDGEQLGALKRSWNGYKGSVTTMAEDLHRLRDQYRNAQKAARAINSIRAEADQDPIHFDELENINALVLDLSRSMAAQCHECHADHDEHEHDVDVGEIEDIREFVAGGTEVEDVGLSDTTEMAVEEAIDVPGEVAGYELGEHDPHNLVWEGPDRRVEVYSHGGSMDHHFSTYVRDTVGDDPGLIADFTDDRLAASDDGADRNRGRAVDAAVSWMRDNPVSDTAPSSTIDTGDPITKRGRIERYARSNPGATVPQVIGAVDDATPGDRDTIEAVLEDIDDQWGRRDSEQSGLGEVSGDD